MPSTFRWSLTVKGTPVGFFFNALYILTSANEFNYLNLGFRVLHAKVLKTSSLLISISSAIFLFSKELSILFFKGSKSFNWSVCLFNKNSLFFIN